MGAVQVWLGVLGALAVIATLVRVVATRPEVGFSPKTRLLIATGLFFILFTAFCAFMATAWSEPVWARLPFIDFFEWPFRWHGFTALGLSWLCAFAVYAAIRLLPPQHAAG